MHAFREWSGMGNPLPDARHCFWRHATLAVLSGIFLMGIVVVVLQPRQGILARAGVPQKHGPLHELETVVIQRAEELEDPLYASDPPLLAAERTQCVIDTLQATAYLGQAVGQLRNAVASGSGLKCPDSTESGCAVSVAGFVTSIAWVASYLSLAASSCAERLNTLALCSADWTAIAANFGELATSGAAASTDCDFSTSQAKPVDDQGKADFQGFLNVPNQLSIIEDLERQREDLEAKLRTARSALGGIAANLSDARLKQVDRNYQIAQCSFDVTQAASYVVRVILQIRDAALFCEDKKDCTLDIFNIISSFAWISQFVALAVVDCPPEGNQHASCAADISDIIAATANLVPASGASLVDCAQNPNKTEIIRLAPGD